MTKRNISYIKPEDPEFLKLFKKQAGYDDRNPKFDKLQNLEDDFVSDGEDEKPQVVVLKSGDLTAEEAESEHKKIELTESQTKADLSQRVVFKSRNKSGSQPITSSNRTQDSKSTTAKKSKPLLSFDVDDSDEDNET